MANLRANNLTGTGGRNAIDGSVFFDGESSYLTMASGEIISGTGFGTNDFTIEFWINQGVNASDYTGIFNLKASTTTDRFQVAFQSSTIQVYTDTSTWRDTGYAPTAGVFEHIAFQRDYSGNTLKMYANGVEKWSVSNTRDYDEAFETFIGLHSSAYGYLEGYLSNLRVCTHLVYASNNFTPPTQKLGLHPETILLCCQDSDDPTQEATGKTITGAGGLDITQTEKINGRWNQDPTGNGWSLHTDASGSYANGQWTVTSPSAIWQGAFTSFTSVIGQRYRLTGLVVTSNNWGSISVSNDGGAAKIVYPAWNASTSFPLTINVIFTATATTTYVSIDNLNTTNNTATTVQYISVKPVEVGKAPKVLPPVGIDEGVVIDGYTKINSQGVMYFPTGDTSQRGRGTALFGGGYQTPNSITAIDYLSIQSGGLTQEWGNLSTTELASGAALSSNTRYIKGGGWTGANNNAIEYVTFTTSGNSLEFGDLTLGRRNIGSHSNDTRGLWAGGYISPADAGTDTIDYVTIATIGNAVDFGNLSAVAKSNNGTGSTTRAVFTLGTSSPAAVDTIEYVTIATTGNATDFGNLEDPLRDNGSCSNGTRAVFAGGTRFPHNAVINTLQFITISSTGNTSNFGDLTLARGAIGGTSNGTRGVFMGGTTNPARQDTIDSVIIATTGEAVNWGDFRTAKQGLNSAASDSHGGLS